MCANHVVVTGLGAISPFGQTVAALWKGVRAGRVAIGPVQRHPMDGYRTRVGGEVPEFVYPRHDYARPEGHREPIVDFALLAAEEAVGACGLDFTHAPPERWGTVIASCSGGIESARVWYQAWSESKQCDSTPLPLVSPHAAAEAVSGAFGLRGPTLSVSNGCAAGASAIGYAADLIRRGRADVVVTGGTDCFNFVQFSGFNALEALSPLPATPYAGDRQGISLGEGAGILVLARADLAEQAGAPILAELAGYGLSADACDPTAPDPTGEGASLAIRTALAASGLQPEDIQYINGHGTGTQRNDCSETAAIRRALGHAADRVAVSSTKSMIGHLLGAAGAIESIVTVEALQHGFAPPTAGLTVPDPECDLDYVPVTGRPLTITAAASNSFGFGGANACVVFARPGVACPPPPSREPVVITGAGLLIPDVDDAVVALTRLRAGEESGSRDREQIGRVTIDASPYLTPRAQRRLDRTGLLAVVTSRRALDDSGLAVTDENRDRIGLIFGTAAGPTHALEEFAIPVLDEGAVAANPRLFPNMVYNAAAGHVGIHLRTRGPTSTLTPGHAAGAAALAYGTDLVATQRADAVLAVGADTVCGSLIRAYRDRGVLRPRGSFTLNEGAAAVVLESLSTARARGARVYGEVLGAGLGGDGRGAGHLDLQGHGMERALRSALDEAGIQPEEVAAIWLSANGYAPTDLAERRAVRRVLGARIPHYAPRHQLGDPMAAGGIMATILALWSAGGSADGPVMVNSTSLTGTHVCLILRSGLAGAAT